MEEAAKCEFYLVAETFRFICYVPFIRVFFVPVLAKLRIVCIKHIDEIGRAANVSTNIVDCVNSSILQLKTSAQVLFPVILVGTVLIILCHDVFSHPYALV